ncbi:Zn-ribbon domain-containing OB-fold protein [Nocardiopsis chromatogenes]|uniref:Zn-ribbon domain-containing OB-fold protein n=1 Tax=Nocardiopsis chromatogenes TaxID=280239 RepID=UPI000349858B|nr:OB-fold domain-containing protein [Nocardiopsis chromatogenes]
METAPWIARGADGPHLLGSRCTACGAVSFPPDRAHCRDPHCPGGDPVVAALPRRGRIWSFTDCRYPPPPPYVPPTDPFEPFVLVAVELDGPGPIVLGQAPPGTALSSLRIGAPAELVEGTAAGPEGRRFPVWQWRPLPDGGGDAQTAGGVR